jgi:hypothetical protein
VVAGTSRMMAPVRAIVILSIVSVTFGGCAGPAPATLNEKLDQEGAQPGTVSPTIMRPDGTLNNGLLPEQWGDTS